MSRVLFLNQPTIGHLNTLLAIALQMREEGHQVHFLVPGSKAGDPKFQILRTAASVPNIIENNRLPVDIVTPPASVGFAAIFLPFKTGYNELVLSIDLFSKGVEYYTKNILEVIERVKPDILVTDFAFFSSHIAAELTGIPCVVLYHSGLPFKGKNIPPFGSGLPITENYEEWQPYVWQEQAVLRQLDTRINAARKKFGLPSLPAEILRTPYSQWLNLVASVEAIEAPRDNLSANTLFVGPCLAEKKNSPESGFPFDQLRSDQYKIYVSLGTVFNNKPRVFQRIMSALNSPDYQIIISAGDAYQTLSQRRKPENVMLFQSVPQVALLPKVDLVIGHGGNNSTNETLAAGKPLIVMPVGGEQGDNASRIEYLKVGLRVNIAQFDENEMLRKVNLIRSTPTFQERASYLKEAIDKTDGAKTASTCIEWVARNKRPLCRPAEFPLTITKENLEDLISG